MITSNIWAGIGLNNVANSEVVDLIYKDESFPRSVNLPEAVIVQFYGLYNYLEPFLAEIHQTVEIPVVRAKCKIPLGHNFNFIHKKLPLMILQDFTIHKDRGKLY